MTVRFARPPTMPKRRFASLPLLLLVLNYLTQAAQAQTCSLSLNRILGRLNNYVWVCDCLTPDGVPEASARTQIRAPSGVADSAARASAFLRCTNRARDRLLHTCLRNRRLFERQAKRTMERCSNAMLSRGDRDLRGAFQVDRSRCEAFLRRFVAGEVVGGIWICSCLQSDGEFRVVPGRAQFLTNQSPTGARRELTFLGRCTGEENREELERVCRETPGDFEILALQLLQVCCKRSRVMFEEKFECAALVPDDVTPIKVALESALRST
eukprot:GFKZ01010298.1.p1 GENE.GFKZ01010298.1~~GFKZ01010298.1.p1  ORF type:complete len:269 (+),score=13.23 GFKZ01010298.1:130-936(+)